MFYVHYANGERFYSKDSDFVMDEAVNSNINIYYV